MSGPEIREKISANNEVIRAAAPLFILNKNAVLALKENKELQKCCPHEYDDMGYCIYCDKKVD